MAKTFADFLIEGAHKLEKCGFGFAVKEGKWDKTKWEETGARRWGASILKPKIGVTPTQAVESIFNNPEIWSFDCSQFCQVVNYYAQMMTLNDPRNGGKSFGKVVKDNGNRLLIMPFLGSVFTARRHYYRREARDKWLVYRPEGDRRREVPTRIGAWDLVHAAPVGTRVNFNVRGVPNVRRQPISDAFNFENTVKVGDGPLKFAAQVGYDKKVWDVEDLIVKLGQAKNPAVKTFAEGLKEVWIKEVSIFATLPFPPHRTA